MLNFKISILDYAGGTANIETWHFGRQKSIQEEHAILLYNGSTHFTRTGYSIVNGVRAHNIFSTAPIKPSRTYF